MKATLRDVAKAAGVGVSTVSYVLNESGLHKVGIETQQRIRDAAAMLNYTPNAIARGLRSGKSSLAGVLVPAIDYSFMPEILAGIDHELSENKYNMLLCTYTSCEELIEKCALLRQKQVDGIIIKAWQDIAPDVLELCRNSSLPCIMVATPTTCDVPGVWVDPASMGRLAFNHLYEQYHRNWAICSITRQCQWLDVMRSMLEEHNLPQNIVVPDEDPQWREKLFAMENITAILTDDEYAVEILHTAHVQHIKVPEELSILVMDGREIDRYSIPPLTCIIQPRAEQGSEAAKLLLEWINTKIIPSNVILQPQLSRRSSIKNRQFL